jgi:S-adenosylmethionine:tRNA ribosyltransferase-isomerase
MDPLNLSDYQYTLPEGRIAIHPLAERDASKLLIYQQGELRSRIFRQLAEELPANSLLVRNETRVIPARLHFRRATGAQIEVLCLSPMEPSSDPALAMAAIGETTWECMVGNLRRWNVGETLEHRLPLQGGGELHIQATRLRVLSETQTVHFAWQPADYPFQYVLECLGKAPLPPYLKREAEPDDTRRYQTVYAQTPGSVAAPTAGLHFTERVFQQLSDKGIQLLDVCLHVGAGTFRPVQTEDVRQHTMHREPISVDIETLNQLAHPAGPVVAVGTTSMRTLESLYWLGVQALDNPMRVPTEVTQWEPYETETQLPPPTEAYAALVQLLRTRGLQRITAETGLMIVPGYRFRVVQGLITNFHQPGSTLILLVAAFIGADWRRVYDFALTQDYRFLSYGDSSLLWRNAL